jgi:hypothetical protein
MQNSIKPLSPFNASHFPSLLSFKGDFTTIAPSKYISIFLNSCTHYFIVFELFLSSMWHPFCMQVSFFLLEYFFSISVYMVSIALDASLAFLDIDVILISRPFPLRFNYVFPVHQTYFCCFFLLLTFS